MKWTAIHCVKLLTAALAAEYDTVLVKGVIAAIDEMLSTTPLPWSAMSLPKT